ncbi:MAG: ABC transporter substrate-binding protein [Alphaproteobacteria bacterium]|nr:ABC transporter substrate-binding protein [Alphaproteobacteria bacterium]
MSDKPRKRPAVDRRELGRLAFGAAASLAAPVVLSRPVLAAERIVVAQPGGPYEAAFTKAFAEPFTKATGVEVALVARPFFPSAQVEAQVEAKNYQWDVVSLSAFDVEILARKNLLEELNLPAKDLEGIILNAIRPTWLGVDIYATVSAYRTDKITGKAPGSWKDFWDLGGIPGRRSLYKNPQGMLEAALMADGVTAKDMYPIDYDRAFKKLSEIKPKIAVWWTGGVQSTQLLRDGDMDLIAIWNGRAQAAIDDGAPAKIVWNQGLYTVHGFSVPKGAPKKAIGVEFIKFCADPERQAAYTPYLKDGPTNTNAFKYIDPKLAASLPSAPSYLASLLELNTAWWTDNKDDAMNRFNEWLLL